MGQLQICAISMYLLTLVQMITSNLEVNQKESDLPRWIFSCSIDYILYG